VKQKRPTADTLMQELLHAAGALQARLDAAFDAVELTASRFTVLDLLATAAEPLPLSELAARSACVRSNMTQLVDRLEADGLVRRVPDPHDRRSILAELTAAGAAKRKEGARALEKVREGFAEAVGERDRVALRRALSALG
jgi:DNA-binding MarR family transcriptional regulator